MKFKKLPVKIISIVFFLIILCGIGYYFYQQKSSQVKTYDNFPIWLLRDGKVAVYQEVSISPNKYERKVVVNNLSEEDQKNVAVYVEIPKEIAPKASELTFNSEVEIIKEDPVVLWSVNKSGEGSEMSWTDTALFLPRAAGLVLTWSRNIAMNNLTDVCKTSTAKDWIEHNTWQQDKTSFLACGDYIEHMEKVIQERTAKDWQNKMDENKITKSLESSDAEYKQIQQKAKEKIAEQAKPTATPKANSGSKISAEEAIAIVKKNSLYSSRYNTQPNLECKATFSQEDNGWRVICSGRNLVVNKFYLQEFYYEFFLVSKDGKAWKEKAVYEKTKDTITGQSFPASGKPMWGVK